MSNEELLHSFRKHLQVEGRANLYYHRMKKFYDDNNEFNRETMENFILSALEKGYKTTTINSYIAAFSSFIKFIKSDIPIPKYLKIDKRIPDSISMKFFEKQFIPKIEEVFPNKFIKYRALLYFMMYTGVRREEVVRLKRKDINLENNEVDIYEKKTKTENIGFFTNKVKKYLEFYFTIEEERINAFNITIRGVNYLFDKMKSYFPDIKLRPHLLRHSFATYLLEQGVDISIIQKLLGHKDIRTTMVYLNTNKDLVRKIYHKHIK